MKRKYTTPEMTVERFVANTAVASCERTFVSTTTTYPAQTVSCLIDGSDTIFTTGTAGCSTVVNLATATTVQYNGTWYYLWQTSGTGAKPTDDTLLKAVLAAAGLTNDGSNSTWHAATFTTGLESLYTDSY